MKFYVFGLLIFVFLCISCENILKSNDGNKKYITKYDVEGMKEKLLPNFKLFDKNVRMYMGRDYRFQDSTTTDKYVEFRIGIHPSKDDAIKFALDYIGWSAGIPQEDSNNILGIGDRCWIMTLGSDTTSYLFLRNNICCLVLSHSLGNLQLRELVRSIDEDIVNDADYIKQKSSISLPKIKKITVSKSELNDGETATIRVSASDPNNKKLECISFPGLLQNGMTFTFQAKKDYVSEPFIGQHTYEFQVINENNVLSKIKEVTITIK